jgi:hypothetical protein
MNSSGTRQSPASGEKPTQMSCSSTLRSGYTPYKWHKSILNLRNEKYPFFFRISFVHK